MFDSALRALKLFSREGELEVVALKEGSVAGSKDEESLLLA